MAVELLNFTTWNTKQDDKGGRIYTIFALVRTLLTTELWRDTPEIYANAAGLPAIGVSWSEFNIAIGAFGRDDWAFLSPFFNVTPYEQKVHGGFDPIQYSLVELRFETTTRDGKYNQWRCNDATTQNPLLEPPRIKLSFQKFRKIPDRDRDDKPYRFTGGEPIVGQEVEIDDNRWLVLITLNQINVDLALIDSLADNLNSTGMWGLPPESVKFSTFETEKLHYAKCTAYVRSTYGFEVRNNWLQEFADKSRMRLSPGGNPSNSDDYEVAKDRFGENLPVLRLDIFGKPIVTDTQIGKTILRNPYKKGDLLQLGIPASL